MYVSKIRPKPCSAAFESEELLATVSIAQRVEILFIVKERWKTARAKIAKLWHWRIELHYKLYVYKGSQRNTSRHSLGDGCVLGTWPRRLALGHWVQRKASDDGYNLCDLVTPGAVNVLHGVHHTPTKAYWEEVSALFRRCAVHDVLACRDL